MRFQNKVIIITGAARGIGQGCALRMGKEGASVICLDRNPPQETVELIKAAGGEALAVTGDVSSAAQWNKIVDDVLRQFGKIDALGNCAGIVNVESEDTVVGCTEEAWDRVISIDLKGTWLGMRAVIPSMIKNGGGRIVNISSLAALRAINNLASYTAAKGGVVGLTMQAAIDYAPHNILINSIAPGTIDTPILAGISDELRRTNTNAHMIKRLGTPADIAGTMAHFFSDDGAFLTGLIYPVDGGWFANGRCH